MYFAVLPLLLLFASTIGASPVHIALRSNSVSAVSVNRRWRERLESARKNNIAYKKWDEFAPKGYTEISGIDSFKFKEAHKMEHAIDGGTFSLVKVYMLVEEDFGPMSTIIQALEQAGQMHSWGWNDTPNPHHLKTPSPHHARAASQPLDHVAFVVITQIAGGEILERYLRTPNANTAAELRTLSVSG